MTAKLSPCKNDPHPKARYNKMKIENEYIKLMLYCTYMKDNFFGEDFQV